MKARLFRVLVRWGLVIRKGISLFYKVFLWCRCVQNGHSGEMAFCGVHVRQHISARDFLCWRYIRLLGRRRPRLQGFRENWWFLFHPTNWFSFQSKYFIFDVGIWLTESTRSTKMTLGTSLLKNESSFQGALSCFQLYQEAMNPAQIHLLMNCAYAKEYKRSNCPENFQYYDGQCYSVKLFVPALIWFTKDEEYIQDFIIIHLLFDFHLKSNFETHISKISHLVYSACA